MNPRTWVFDNRIRATGRRNGVHVACGRQNAPKYFLDNTVVHDTRP